MFATLDDILQSHRTRRPIVMGILNVTPDSFSDGGEFFAPAMAVAHAADMFEVGADIIDVGSESTRPGSDRVSPDEQIARIEDVLCELSMLGVVISIDTTSAAVAEYALDAGATIINDVSAGREDTAMLPLAAERGAGVVLMHMLGQPKTMQADPVYGDVTTEVREFLAARLAAAEEAGVPRARCIVDPGIGFGKTAEHNLSLLAQIDELASLGLPVMVGPSRKRFIGEITGEREPSGRVAGTIAACLAGWRGGATIFRVHDVAPVWQALAMAAAVDRAARDKP